MKTVGFDTETHLISAGTAAPTMVCASLFEEDRTEVVTKDRDLIRQTLFEADRVVGLNLAFDFWVLIESGVMSLVEVLNLYDDKEILDIGIREKLYRITRDERKRYKYSLAALTERYLGKTLPKGQDTWRLRYAELDHVPVDDWPADAVRYAMEDARCPVKVLHEMSQGPFPSEQNDNRASFVLGGMTVRGLKIDQGAHARLYGELDQIRERYLSELQDLGLMTPNPKNKSGWSRNNKKLQGMVFDAYDGDPPLTTTGKVSLAKETLMAIDGFEPLEPVTGYMYADKMITTYLEAMDGPEINCSYDPVIDTGRTSSYGPKKDSDMYKVQGARGCNFQNIPSARRRGWGDGPWIRDLIVARPGHKLVVVDYDSMELRVLGQTCLDLFGQSDIVDQYQSNPDWDPHTWAIWRRHPARVQIERGAEGWSKWHKTQRDASKVQIYGGMGGMGGATLHKNSVKDALNNGGEPLSLDMCRELSRQFREGQIFGEMVPYFELANVEQGVPVPSGRLGRVRLASSFPKAANTKAQGPAADIIKRAMWAGATLPFVGMVHDELICEAREDEAEQVLEQMIQVMTQSAGVLELIPDVPLRASGVIVDRYGEAK